MTTILNFKDLVDLPKWRVLSSIPSASILVTSTATLISDLRNNDDRHPIIYFTFANNFFWYNIKNDSWILPPAGTFSFPFPNIMGFFMPAQGPRGTISAGATTTSIPLTTALPATVTTNQLANRGDGRGFKVRIIGNAGGSSGKTEERLVIANTSGTTPTLLLDSPLSFVPIAGDRYEFLSGRVFLLGSTNAAGSWKYYDILTNSMSANLATANLPASWSDANLVGLDELFVPFDRNPGEGLFGILTATATSPTTLTGQAVGGDAGVVANQYRNFQIRVVQDTLTPTAVGQRVNIGTAVLGHTAGPSPVYTISGWSVIQPSATAKYVIENNGDRIIASFAATTNINTYTISTNAWDVAGTIFANRTGATPSTGMVTMQSFAIEPDIATTPNARQSFIFSFRGGTTAILDFLDISGAAIGVWTTNITYGNKGQNINTTGFAYDVWTNQGRYIYIATPFLLAMPFSFLRFDMKNRAMESYPSLRAATSGTASGQFKLLTSTAFIDGNTKLSSLIYMLQTTVNLFGLPIIK